MKLPCGACSGWLVTDLGAPEDSSEFQGKTDTSLSHPCRDLNLWKVTTRPDAKVLSGTGIQAFWSSAGSILATHKCHLRALLASVGDSFLLN